MWLRSLALLIWVGTALTVAPTAAMAGGIECPDRQGSYSIVYALPDGPVTGSFDAFRYEFDGKRVTVVMHRSYRITVAFAATDTWGWGFDLRDLGHRTYRYDSPRQFSQLTFCVSPDTTGGLPQQALWQTNTNQVTVGNNNYQSAHSGNAGRVPSQNAGWDWGFIWSVIRTIMLVVGVGLSLLDRILPPRRPRQELSPLTDGAFAPPVGGADAF